MTTRPIAQQCQLAVDRNGNGFTVYNLQGQLGFLDPFLTLADFQMPNAYFPPHPHAGFSVMTYLFPDSEGAFINRDSFGDHSRIEAGGLHWTQAGRGLQHEEIPEREGQPCHGLQMWINHADRDRLSEPTRFHVAPDQVPEVRPAAGVLLRVLVGEAFGIKADFKPITPINFFDVFLDAGAVLRYPTTDETALALFIVGTAQVARQPVNAHTAITFAAEGEMIEIRAGEMGCEFLLGTGRPFNEPIAYGGPFVMTTPGQVADARGRFSRGEMGQLAPSPVFG